MFASLLIDAARYQATNITNLEERGVSIFIMNVTSVCLIMYLCFVRTVEFFIKKWQPKEHYSKVV